MQVIVLQRQNVDIIRRKILSSVRSQRREKAHPVVIRKDYGKLLFERSFEEQLTFQVVAVEVRGGRQPR